VLHKHLQLCVELAVQQPGRVGAGQLERRDIPPWPPCSRTLLRRCTQQQWRKCSAHRGPTLLSGLGYRVNKPAPLFNVVHPSRLQAAQLLLGKQARLTGAQHCQRLCLHLPEAVEQNCLIPIRNKASQRSPHKQ